MPLCLCRYPRKIPLRKGPELQLAEQLLQGFGIRWLHLQGLLIKRNGNIQDNGRQCLRYQGLVTEFLYLLFPSLIGYGVGLKYQVFNGAKGGDQFPGCYFTKARDPGDVIGGIPPQPEDIFDLFRPFDPKLLTNLIDSENFRLVPEFCRFIHQDMIGDKLAEVFVGGHHVRDEGLLFSLFGQGADHIIGFVSVHCQDGDVETGNQALDQGNGGDNIFRSLLPVGFVEVKFFVPDGGGHGIEGDTDVGWLFVFDHFEEGIGKTKDSRGVDPL